MLTHPTHPTGWCNATTTQLLPLGCHFPPRSRASLQCLLQTAAQWSGRRWIRLDRANPIPGRSRETPSPALSRLDCPWKKTFAGWTRLCPRRQCSLRRPFLNLLHHKTLQTYLSQEGTVSTQKERKAKRRKQRHEGIKNERKKKKKKKKNIPKVPRAFRDTDTSTPTGMNPSWCLE